MLRRFSANDTHLYPGALLRGLDAPDEAGLAADDEVLVEFSDGMHARGRVLKAGPDGAELWIPAWLTLRKTMVAQRRWRVAPGHETDDGAGSLRVLKRLA